MLQLKTFVPVRFNTDWIVSSNDVDRLGLLRKLKRNFALSAPGGIASADLVEAPGFHKIDKADLSFGRRRFRICRARTGLIRGAQSNDVVEALAGSAVIEDFCDQLGLRT